MASELPIVTVTVIDKESGNETPVNVKTCTDGVTCPEGKTMSEHLQALYGHSGNADIHLTKEQKNSLETQAGAQAKAKAAQDAAISAASLMAEKAKAESTTFATQEAVKARDAAYRYADGKAAVSQEHANNTSNPHGVTAEQVGLGNVPNKTTNDLTPTYEKPPVVQNLTSGEKLSVAFGKIASAISLLLTHNNSKGNPHSVTAKQVGALPTAGGTMTGNLAMGGGYITLTRGRNYGTEDEIPEDFPEGGLWLKVVE